MRKRETFAESQQRYLREQAEKREEAIAGMIEPVNVIDENVPPLALTSITPKMVLTMEYKNWRGEVAIRTIVPVEIWFGKTDWHPEQQWFIKATDVDKSEIRDFALRDCKWF